MLIRGSIAQSLAVIAYLAAVQPMLRLFGTSLPHFMIEYGLLAWFGLMIVSRGERIKLNAPLLWYSAYISLELISVFRTDFSNLVRGVLIPSLTLWLFLLVAAQIRVNRQQIQKVFNGYIIGSISLAIIIGKIYTEGRVISWSTNSNFAASGGMGPVQVGFILSVACFLCLVSFEYYRNTKLRYGYLLICTILAYLMILTFARGGLYIFGGAVILYYLLLRRPNLGSMLTIIFGIALVFGIFQVGIATTQGAIIERYSEQNTSNRWTLVQQGWRIFLENPVLGVGTSNYHKTVSQAEYFGSVSGAHNELIRAAAEHGLPGLVTWSGFAIASLVVVFKGPREARALRLTLLAIAFVSTFYNGLKLLAQPLLFLLVLSFQYYSTATQDESMTEEGKVTHFLQRRIEP